MTRRQQLSGVCIILIVGALPLIRLSIEDSFLTRHTWSWLAGILSIVILLFLLNYKRVHLLRSPIVLIGISIPLISAAIGILPAQPVALLYSTLVLAVTYSISIVLATRKLSLYILYTLLCAICLYAQWGIVQYVVQKDLGLSFIGESIVNTSTSGVATYYDGAEKFIRSYGPFGHPNSLAGVLVIGCIICVYLFPQEKNVLFMLPIFATLLIGILTTFSRSALLASVITLFVGAIMGLVRNTKITVAIITILICLSPLMVIRTSDSHDVAAHDRLEGLRWAYSLTTPASFIRGLGIGNYERALSAYLTSHHITHNTWDIAPVHSVPLQLLMEIGIVLTIIICALVFIFLKQYNLWIFMALFPTLLVDHYFITQLGPLILLIVSASITARAILKGT